MSIIKYVTLHKIVAHDFRYDPRIIVVFRIYSCVSTVNYWKVYLREGKGVIHIMSNIKSRWLWVKEERQCAFNVTLRRAHATIVAWNNNKCYILWVSVCSFRYPASNAHARIFICGLFGPTIFSHIVSQKACLRIKKVLNIKCVFWFSLRHLSEKIFILRRV